MIKDRIANAGSYSDLGSRIAAGLSFLQRDDLRRLEQGRHEISGDECYAIIEDYLTQPRAQKRWETHRSHIDIQFLAYGRELIGCADVPAMRSVEYHEDRDLEFLDGPDGEFVTVQAGTFVILHPQDAHMPGVAVSGPEPVRKIVVKVLVD